MWLGIHNGFCKNVLAFTQTFCPRAPMTNDKYKWICKWIYKWIYNAPSKKSSSWPIYSLTQYLPSVVYSSESFGVLQKSQKNQLHAEFIRVEIDWQLIKGLRRPGRPRWKVTLPTALVLLPLDWLTLSCDRRTQTSLVGVCQWRCLRMKYQLQPLT